MQQAACSAQYCDEGGATPKQNVIRCFPAVQYSSLWEKNYLDFPVFALFTPASGSRRSQQQAPFMDKYRPH